jgi:hypothetical protein
MLVSWQRKPSSNNWKRWVLVLKPGDAVYFALLFPLGLFITVAGIGVICALLGRMLGDIANDWQILIGMVLVWVALGMLGMEKLSINPYQMLRYGASAPLSRLPKSSLFDFW